MTRLVFCLAVCALVAVLAVLGRRALARSSSPQTRTLTIQLSPDGERFVAEMRTQTHVVTIKGVRR